MTIEDDRRWAVAQYEATEGRKPTPQELDDVVNMLQSGWSRDDVVKALDRVGDVEGFVTKTYQQAYGRPPTANELAIMSDSIRKGQNGRKDWSNWLHSTSEALLREPPDPTAADDTGAKEDAFAYVQQLLNDYGLGSLSDWAWQEIVNDRSPQRVMQDLRQRDEYKQRFIGMAERKARGLPAISEAEYISWERGARQMMQAAGLPADFYDQPTDFGTFIGRDVSLQELSDRVNDGFRQAMAAPAEVRDEMQRLYGVGAGQLAAFFLDPDRALPVIERQFAASQLSGAAQRTTYGGLSQSQAERLAALGLDEQQAQQGFGNLVEASQLFAPLAGQDGEGISRDEQLAAAFEGNAAAQQKIARTGQERVSQGSGAQAFQIGNSGVVGLGRERR